MLNKRSENLEMGTALNNEEDQIQLNQFALMTMYVIDLYRENAPSPPALPGMYGKRVDLLLIFPACGYEGLVRI